MRCPFCGAADTRVLETRSSPEGESIRRRRGCDACGGRFTTFERVELALPLVVKRDGTRVAFDEGKLRAGMLKALEKRPVSAEALDVSLARIRSGFARSGEREVSTRALGEAVMRELERLDPVAYMRFASVYLSFDDVNAFCELAGRLAMGRAALREVAADDPADADHPRDPACD